MIYQIKLEVKYHNFYDLNWDCYSTRRTGEKSKIDWSNLTWRYILKLFSTSDFKTFLMILVIRLEWLGSISNKVNLYHQQARVKFYEFKALTRERSLFCQQVTYPKDAGWIFSMSTNWNDKIIYISINNNFRKIILEQRLLNIISSSI